MAVRKMARSSLCTAMLCICAWLSVPLGDVRITMQTFGVAFCLGLLGGKWGTMSVLLYLLLGAVGLPVFGGFRGGLGALLDVSGGYLTGFLAMALVYWLLTALFGNSKKVRFIAFIMGLLLCYTFGTLWYWGIYMNKGYSAAFWVIGAKCVVPFIIPDGIKLALAWFLTDRMKRIV